MEEVLFLLINKNGVFIEIRRKFIFAKCYWLPSSCDTSLMFFKFQKIMKINPDIVNDVTYNHEMFYYEIL
jgi:hypothetical protein